MKSKMPAALSRGEETLALQLRAVNLPPAAREYRFDKTRRWRFDFAWPEIKLAVEIDGILPGSGGRHQRAGGYEKDLEKINTAILDGWRVLRFTTRAVTAGAAIDLIRAAINQPRPGTAEPSPNSTAPGE